MLLECLSATSGGFCGNMVEFKHKKTIIDVPNDSISLNATARHLECSSVASGGFRGEPMHLEHQKIMLDASCWNVALQRLEDSEGKVMDAKHRKEYVRHLKTIQILDL
ncbi:hypothetical protein CEXT_65731 [Caerostris extrusa]|uniref:Uncharacterized protein n=1 Tax=Caerostris extrusa TaxID=172846 RepID=A0AAV4SEW2_CAEEX|nr:hypothetical protein CEXT_65731 [Caerostris extrusa]